MTKSQINHTKCHTERNNITCTKNNIQYIVQVIQGMTRN